MISSAADFGQKLRQQIIRHIERHFQQHLPKGFALHVDARRNAAAAVEDFDQDEIQCAEIGNS